MHISHAVKAPTFPPGRCLVSDCLAIGQWTDQNLTTTNQRSHITSAAEHFSMSESECVPTTRNSQGEKKLFCIISARDHYSFLRILLTGFPISERGGHHTQKRGESRVDHCVSQCKSWKRSREIKEKRHFHCMKWNDLFRVTKKTNEKKTAVKRIPRMPSTFRISPLCVGYKEKKQRTLLEKDYVTKAIDTTKWNDPLSKTRQWQLLFV